MIFVVVFCKKCFVVIYVILLENVKSSELSIKMGNEVR